MFKKVLKILVALLILFMLVASFLTYKGYNTAKKEGKNTAQLKDYFPFGRVSNNPKNSQEEIDIENSENESETDIEDNEPNKKLIQVSDEPVAGYAFKKKKVLEKN